jgi:hypothetical protein
MGLIQNFSVIPDPPAQARANSSLAATPIVALAVERPLAVGPQRVDNAHVAAAFC